MLNGTTSFVLACVSFLVALAAAIVTRAGGGIVAPIIIAASFSYFSFVNDHLGGKPRITVFLTVLSLAISLAWWAAYFPLLLK